MVHLLFEKGWPERGGIEKVYMANFENAVRFISRENATL
jgi:hypothetical protein